MIKFKVLMATNRPDTLRPALFRLGYLTRKLSIAYLISKEELRFKIHYKAMNMDKGIRLELLARFFPNSTQTNLRSFCQDVGMFTIRQGMKR